MPLVLGALTLSRTESFTIMKSVTYPKYAIPGKSTGTIDSDADVREPDTFRIVCEVNDTDRKTLQDTYLNTLRALSDADSGLSETVHVEKVDCEYLAGYDYNSEYCWRCTVGLVLSNS